MSMRKIEIFILIIIIASICCREATISITLPSYLSEDKTALQSFYDNSEFYKNIRVNSNGSLTITMNKAGYDYMIHEMENAIFIMRNKILEEYPEYISAAKYNNHFKELIIEVNSDHLSDEITQLYMRGFIVIAEAYQELKREKVRIEITILDAETKEVIQNTIYPPN